MRSLNRQVPIHYLRPNHTSWSPPALLSFDTETRQELRGDDEIHTMRLWTARYTDRRVAKKTKPRDEGDWGRMPADLAIYVHKLTRCRRTVWAYAHNLHFDLMVSDLIGGLGELGWEVTEFAFDGGSPFLRLKQGDHNLTIADSWSWFPVKLAAIGDAVGIVKPPLPDWDDSEDAWLARCEADTDILHTAMLRMMDWWDESNLGRWNITGSASGFNAMRHKPMADRILIRPEEREAQHDRSAIYGGRRYVWRVGNLPKGRFVEADIEKAYPTACRYLPLPCERMATFTNLPVSHRWVDCSRHGIIAEVTLSTQSTRYPTRIAGHVWYPTGVYRTILAGPEIREARDRGELVAIHSGWLHRLGYALAPWAQWCIESQCDDVGRVPDLAKIALRHWGRAVVGKWAQRGFTVVRLGYPPTDQWSFSEAWDHGAQAKASIVDFGGQRWQVSANAEAENGYPAILAYVESWTRVALSRAIDTVGASHIIQCDTDGFIIDAHAAARLSVANQATEPFTVREKRAYHSISVIGPQHFTADQVKRTSGVPASAQELPDGSLWARTWPKLAWQLQHGRAGEYVRPVQHYRLASTYAPGWVTADGSVLPPEAAYDERAGNRLLPWGETSYAASGAILGPHQHRILAALNG